jgi:hypothetical protein
MLHINGYADPWYHPEARRKGCEAGGNARGAESDHRAGEIHRSDRNADRDQSRGRLLCGLRRLVVAEAAQAQVPHLANELLDRFHVRGSDLQGLPDHDDGMPLVGRDQIVGQGHVDEVDQQAVTERGTAVDKGLERIHKRWRLDEIVLDCAFGSFGYAIKFQQLEDELDLLFVDRAIDGGHREQGGVECCAAGFRQRQQIKRLHMYVLGSTKVGPKNRSDTIRFAPLCHSAAARTL